VATREEITQRVLDRLTERVGEYKPCVVCGQQDWLIQDLYTVIPLTGNPNTFQQPSYGAILPSVPLICQNCGNTHLINLLVLGFDLGSLKIDGDH
jgi:hypothetical protein